jgi:glycosyltransferase involved in cell wall biosynthesis
LKILVTLEEHLWRVPGGQIYTQGPADYSAWSELLSIFEEVVLLARVGNSKNPSAEQNRIDGPSISVHELSDYNGPWQYLHNSSSLRTGARQALAQCDVYLLRAPGLVARLAWQEIRRANRIFAVQAVGDPSDALSAGTISSVFRRLYRHVAVRNMRHMCEQANAVLYCSKNSLPQLYPPAKGSYSVSSPWVILTEGYASSELMTERRLRIEEMIPSSGYRPPPLRLGFIGSFAQLYKGADTLLRAASICSRTGLEYKIFFVGEGRYRGAMQSLAADLSIQEKTVFLGQLGFGKPVFDFLDSVDLFLMPSRAEAFGRALLEAMARGCPCIGSNVGGIPEMLGPEDLVPRNNPEALARKIMEVVSNPERMKAMSARNLARAKEFDPEVLKGMRLAFYQYVRDHSGNAVKSRRDQQ